MGKIISLNETVEKYNAEAFLSIFKIAFFVQLKSIENCVAELYGFKYQKFGLVFGDTKEGDFVTLEKEPKVYPYYTRMFDNEFYNDDEPGIYVANLIGFDYNDETIKFYEKYKDLAAEVEKWYFDVYLQDELRNYTFNPEELDGIDKAISEVIKKTSKDNNEKIVQFRKKQK